MIGRGRDRRASRARIALLGSVAAVAAAASTSCSVAARGPAAAPIIRVEGGEIRGTTAGGVTAFKGVPYAQPPVGPLRWRAPQPVRPWAGVRAADRFGPACRQTAEAPQSEDCLTLNIWRPTAAPPRPSPVMVWIHGGALVEGQASNWPGDALARQGVVVVSMNYRLGRLGFFAHPALTAEAPEEVHANYGHLDQRAALQWVQRNIAALGGDPGQVTIFGESAGGGSVLVHLTSPLSRGLFQRAILQSPGVPTARARVLPLSEMADAERLGVEYARSLGITGAGAETLKALRAVPADRLIQGSSAEEVLIAIVNGGHAPGMPGAVRDGRLIIEAPETVLARQRQAKVPIIVGANSRDLGLGVADTKDELFALFGRRAAEARRLYDPKDDLPLEELKQQVLADGTLVEPARHLADAHAQAGLPVWSYRFSYVAEAQRDELPGAPHALDVPYTFGLPAAALDGGKVAAADRAMGRTASGYWTTFAKTGDPNGAGRPQWPRHTPGAATVFNFRNDGAGVGPDPLKARLDLWAEVFDEKK